MADLGRVTLRALGGDPVTIEQLLDAPVRWPRPSRLRRPVDAPRRTQEAAANLGIETVGDLFEHVPVGHEFRTEAAIADLRPGAQATIEVQVKSIALRPTRRSNFKIVEARVSDGSATAKAVWFNQGFLVKQLPPGTRVRLFGELKRGAFQVREHTVLAGPPSGPGGRGIVAIYPGTEGLKSQRLRELVAEVRGEELETVEPLPARLRARLRVLDRPAALAAMHFPQSEQQGDAARERLAFEELLLQQLALGLRRRRRQSGATAIELPRRDALVASWRKRLPFAMTEGQEQAIAEIDADIERPEPMQRLLMGEVGSGKTVVALAAMLRAAENDAQAALMAPTETLAEQHFATLDAMLPEVPLGLLTGSSSASHRKTLLARLATGELPLIVGTHALIEPDVEFRRLALAVVDEQHRFGVRQRRALDAKSPAGHVPHVLHMTATPIPRTLALTGWGDLDFTRLTELPRGRMPITTRVYGDAQRGEAYELVREQLRAGRQAYVVCPLVAESDVLEARAATAEAERLAAGEFKNFDVQLIHGQMKSQEKQAAMRRFAAGDADVLVATSVIEVGIDVPNATVMIIEDAERYGISQLHQLRGRVGRGEHESHCLLFGSPGSPRMRALARERDGFKLAQIDLELRGSGEELGTRQSGLPRFRVATLPADTPLLEHARRVARRLLDEPAAFELPEYELLRERVEDVYGPEIDPIPA